MENSNYFWLAPVVAFLVPAVGWILREVYFRRERKTKATLDASQILKDQKNHIEDMISKTDDKSQKEIFCAKLDEINDELQGLYAISLRRTLKDAGLPPEDMLISNGLRHLKHQEVAKLESIISELNTLPPFISTRDLIILGNVYYFTGKYEDAKNIYDKMLELNPKNHYTLNSRGITNTKLGRYENALADFNNALSLEPDNPTILMNRACNYQDLKKYQEALADYNHSLEIRPDDPMTLSNRGSLYVQLERYDDALNDFNHSISLHEHPIGLYNRGQTVLHPC